MSRAFIVIFTGLMVGLGPVSIDSYAPIQGLVKEGLDLTQEQTLLGMSYMIFSMGLFQIAAGPLSDRYGRKRVMMLGIATFIVGTVTCAFAGNLAVLLAGRVLQGAGAAAGQIVGRAVLRDLYSGPDLAHVNAGSMGTMAAIVFVAPLISHFIASVGGWNAPFFALLLYGLLLLGLTATRYKETLAEHNEDALKLAELKSSAISLVKHPQSRTFLLVLIISGIAMLTYVISAQLVYEKEYGVTGFTFAALYSLIGLGVFTGQMLNRALIHSLGTLTTAAAALAVAFLAAIVGLTLSSAGLLGEYGFACVIFVFAMGTMMCVANSMALVMDPHGRIAGFASSMIGFLSFVIASSVGTVIAWLNKGDATATLASISLALALMLALVLDWFWRARHRYAATAAS